MALAYGLLGPLAVTRDGRALDLGAPKQRVVLALLLLERGRVVSTDRLVDAAWPEDAPPSAVPSLQAYLSNLRRLLREPGLDAGRVTPLARQAPGYRLDVSDAGVDLDDYLAAVGEQAEAAARHDWRAALTAYARADGFWRGPLLADLADEEWVQAEATALADRRTQSRTGAVVAHAATGDLGTALVIARGLQSEHPWRDDVAALLVRVLARAGRTTEALDTYRAYADGLAEDLGLDPGAELRALQQAVLRGDASLTAWPEGSAPAAPPAPLTQAGPASPTAPDEEKPPAGVDRFVGRSEQLGVLDTALQGGRQGRTTWAVLSGPPGIGKTRLAQEAVAHAERAGATVVWGRCLEEEGAPAWWPWRAVVRALGANPAQLLAPPVDADADEGRFLVYERLEELLRRSATDAPLVVVLDDLQWADGTSLAALASLAATLRDASVAVVGTIRDGARRPAPQEALSRCLAAPGRAPDARELAVGPLAADEVADVVGTVSGENLSSSDAAALAERTGGNPLFVREYARLPPGERFGAALPTAVRAVLGRRLAALDAGVLEVVRAAAVIGERVDLPLLAAVARIDPDRVADLLDSAADEGIIGPTPGGVGYGFTHALLRDEVLAGLSQIRLQRLHLRVAEAVDHAPASSTEEPLARRAHHLVLALPLVDPERVVEACRAAARRAEEQWSSETAAGWWEAALTAYDLLPPARRAPGTVDELLVARVEALARAGRGQTVLDVVDASLVHAVSAGRTSTVGRLAATLLRSTGTWPWVTFGVDPGPLLKRLGTLQTFVERDPAAQARLLAALGVGRCYDPDPAVPDRLTTRALEVAERHGDPDALADALLGRVLTYIGVAEHAVEAEELLERLATLPRERPDVDLAVRHSAETMCRMLLGDVDGAADHLWRGAAEADRLRLPAVRAQLRWVEFALAAWHGQADAPRLLDAAIRAHRRTELYEGGVDALAGNTLGLDSGRFPENPILPGGPGYSVWEALRASDEGDRERAVEMAWQRLSVPGAPNWFTLALMTVLGHVTADLEATELVPPLLERLVPNRDKLAIVGQVGVVGPVALALARLEVITGDLAAARADLERATAMARSTRGPACLLRCRVVEQELRLAEGREVQRAELAAVVAEARRLGAFRLAAAAEQLGAWEPHEAQTG